MHGTTLFPQLTGVFSSINPPALINTLPKFSIPEHGLMPWRSRRCNRGRRSLGEKPATVL